MRTSSAKGNSDSITLLCEYRPFAPIDHDNLCFMEDDLSNPGTDVRDYSNLPNDQVDIMRELGICNGFRIWCNSSPESITHATKGGCAVLIDSFRIEYWRKQAKTQKKTARQYTDEMIDYIRDQVKENKNRVWLNLGAEWDNHPWDILPAKKNRAEAFDMLTEYFTVSNFLEVFPSEHDPENLAFSPYNYMKERGIKPEDINLTLYCCQPFTPHLLYKIGATAIFVECNVGLNNQVMNMFVTGAARQYGRPWFHDIASFDCHGYPTLPSCYDLRRRRIAGFSENFLLKSWLTSYLSGASMILFQTSSAGFINFDKDNNFRLSPLGELARDFSNFCRKKHPGRGRKRSPIALLLAENHGFMPPYRGQSRVFWGKSPDDRANHSIDAFFRLALPGYQDMHGTGNMDDGGWAPEGSYEKQQPWMTPETKDIKSFGHNFRNSLRGSSFDQRPFEKPYFAPATWGDSFEALAGNAPLEVLKEYPAIIMLGNIKVDDALRAKLTEYVKTGGKLLLNYAQVSELDHEWLGISFAGEMERHPHHTHSLLTGRQFAEGEYQYAKIQPAGKTEVLIETGFINVDGDPILTKHKLGKGEVWFVTVPDYLPTPEKIERTWLEGCKEAVDEFIRPHLPVSVKGEPLEWIANDASDGSTWISLFNNSTDLWSGKVKLQENHGIVTCQDLWSDKSFYAFEYDTDGKVILKPEIAPWDFKIIQIKPVS